jgi:hypothetical protein
MYSKEALKSINKIVASMKPGDRCGWIHILGNLCWLFEEEIESKEVSKKKSEFVDMVCSKPCKSCLAIKKIKRKTRKA